MFAGEDTGEDIVIESQSDRARVTLALAEATLWNKQR